MTTIALRVASRFVWASLASEFERKMDEFFSGPITRERGQEVGKWMEEHFFFLGTKTPKGQKELKEHLKSLHWRLMYGIGQSAFQPERAKESIEYDWGRVKPRLADVARYFSEEGGRSVPKQIELGGNTYINVSGFDAGTLEKYAKRLEAVFADVKGWRAKALSGGIKVALAGPKEFRGTASGKYKSDEDTLYVRATPNILSRSGKTYASFEYIIVHELGHRYEWKNHVPEDFDKQWWWTTRYSFNEGESFAELFALSNFNLTGTWDQSIVNRFEAVMTGHADQGQAAG